MPARLVAILTVSKLKTAGCATSKSAIGPADRAEGRLLILADSSLLAFGTIGVRMGVLAATEPQEPRSGRARRRDSRAAPISLTATAG